MDVGLIQSAQDYISPLAGTLAALQQCDVCTPSVSLLLFVGPFFHSESLTTHNPNLHTLIQVKNELTCQNKLINFEFPLTQI